MAFGNASSTNTHAEPLCIRCKACGHDGATPVAVINAPPCPNCGANWQQFEYIDVNDTQSLNNFYTGKPLGS